MFDSLDLFHFIRPIWLFAMLPVLIIIIGLMLKSTRQKQWANVIDQHLLDHLLVAQKKIQQSIVSPLLFLALSLLLAVFALAGPTWQKRPLPVFETEMSKVILLDLSLSMNATDIKPSRLVRARQKIKDILSKTKEGQVALIVYAGDAFVISPLTTDAKTILTLIPPLSPSLMPVLGSEPQNAFKLADELLTNAGVFSGQIIWITDGVDDQDYGLVAKQLKSSRHQISILAVGTHEGAPIPLSDEQGFLKDSNGAIVIPSLSIAPLEQLANISDGNITRLTADDSDIEQLLSALEVPQEFVASDDDLEMDTWVELGPWLLIPVIIFVALAFRKGIVIVLALSLLPIFPTPDSNAAEQTVKPNTEQTAQTEQPSAITRLWKNLWQTTDQQAAEAFTNNDHQAAADLFQQQDWKSAALYKAGQFNAASDLLSNIKTSTADYNEGNALAQLGRFEESIAAYERALETSPNMEDAKFNKALVEEMLKRKKEQQEGDKQEQNEQPQDGEQQKGDQENEQKSEQQQEGDKQESEEQKGEEKEGEKQQSELEQMTEAEKEQVLEQWLRMIKDDPGGLLRRKMYMEYQRRQQQGKKLQDKGEKVW